MKTIFLLRGVPGVGKTTLATYLAHSLRDTYAASADDFMFADGQKYDKERLTEVHEKCQKRVRKLMSQNKTHIVVHNTMTREWEFEAYIKLAEEFDYRVVSLIVENRHGNKSVHPLPEEDYAKYADRFEVKLKT